MADLATLENALRKADALARQGDQRAASDAKAIADAIRAQRAQVAAPVQSDFRGEGGGRGSGIEAALIGARQGVTFGAGDEINAGVRAAGDWIAGQLPGGDGTSFGAAYDKRLEHERGLLDQTRRENPVATTVGEIGGAVAPALLTGGASATTLPGAIGKGALGGGASGAAFGFGDAEGGVAERVEGTAKGAAVGALFGATAQGAINVGTRGFRRVFGKAMEKPTIESLRAAKAAAYRAVDDAGEVFQPGEIQGLAAKAREAVESGHYVPDVDRQTAAGLTILERQGKPLTLGQVDKIRQNLWKRYNAAPNETGILDIIDSIDDLVNSREATSDLLSAARMANSQYKKAELLESAFKKARDQTSSTGSGGNILNKYRQAVTSIVNDPKRAKWFSPKDISAMQRLIDGSTGEDILRRVGKLAPGGNGLMLALNLMGGATFGAGSLAVTAAAIGAKDLADRSATRLSENALATVAGAAPPTARPVAVSGPVNAMMGYIGSR